MLSACVDEAYASVAIAALAAAPAVPAVSSLVGVYLQLPASLTVASSASQSQAVRLQQQYKQL